MIGQIRSYISFLSVDSDQEYIDRIKNMIDKVEDDTARAKLILEYTNELKKIDLIKKYKVERDAARQKEEKPEETNENVVTNNQGSIEEKIKTFEEELNEKIKEYQTFTKTNHPVNVSKSMDPEYVYASAYTLVKTATSNPVLTRKIYINNSKGKVNVLKRNNMPSLPIMDD